MGIDQLLRESRSPAPDFSVGAAAGIALEHYGIEGTCQPLAGERDLNLCLQERQGSRHLLKIWNHTQDPAVIDFQLGLLRHLQHNAPGLPVPRIVNTRNGQAWATTTAENGRSHTICMFSWLDGRFLRDCLATSTLFTGLGSALAQLDGALANFEHSASHRDMLWDVSRAHRLRPLLSAVTNHEIRQLAKALLERFESQTLPALPALPEQVVHADFNLDNVLVQPSDDGIVSGIIDFGDALSAPRICDLAIASAYHLVDGEEPLLNVRKLVLGYHARLGLGEEEIIRLPDLIGARLVSSILITSHMAELHPHNRDYLLIDTQAAAVNLKQLLDQDLDALSAELVQACRQATRG